MSKVCPACKIKLPENVIFKSSIVCGNCDSRIQNQAPIQYLVVAVFVVGALIVLFGIPTVFGGAHFGKGVGSLLGLIAVCFLGSPLKVMEGSGNADKIAKSLYENLKKLKENDSKVSKNIQLYKEHQRLIRERKKWWQFWL